jgi:hypothetical protein
MGNSNVLSFSTTQSTICDFELMHRLLRYVYATKKNISALEVTETQEYNALQQTYHCRAALKRRLKQIAMLEHELQDQEVQGQIPEQELA